MTKQGFTDTIYSSVRKQLETSEFKPAKVLEVIFETIEAAKIPVKEVSSVAQKLYTRLYQDFALGDQNQARQSWVVASGNNFENLIRTVINTVMNREGILAIKGDKLRTKQKASEIVEFLTLRARRRCTQMSTGVWPDSDIVVLTRDSDGRFKTFALISCKTSDHSRNDSVMFWALALRETNIKYCLATMDLDGKFKNGDGHPRISGHRKKAEAYLDRVYSTNPNTTPCSQVFKLDLNQEGGADLLLQDLRRWREAAVQDFSAEPIDETTLG